MAKTWRQKHDGHKQEAQIERLPRRYAGLSAGSTIVIASPQEISAYFRSVPKGRTRTINQLRDTLAKRHGADAACPMTTGIFCRIAAEAALETIQHGAKWNQVPPFWRVIDPGSPLAKKLSCGPDFIRQRREEEGITDRVMLGTVCGVLLGLLAVGMMLPMSFPDKRAALIGAFLNRLSIGVSIGLGAASVSLPGWAVGLGLGLLLSAGDAVITKAYLPILTIGALGGSAIGFVVTAWGV